MGTAVIYNGEWVDPPFAWEMTYAWVEQCLGKRGDFSRIHFGLADSMTVRGGPAIGMWFVDAAGEHVIVYARSWLGVNADLIIHEMIHDIGGPSAGEWPTPIGERESREFKKCLPSQRTP